jgi:hypothetical protein
MALMRSMLYTELQLVAVRQSVRSSGGPAEKVVKQMAYFNAGGMTESGAIRAKGAGRRGGARVLTQGLCALALCSGVLLSVVTGATAATADTAASTPTCSLTTVNVGPPSQEVFTTQDPVAGLASVHKIRDHNATKTESGFSPGTTGPVTVTFTKVDEAIGSEAGIEAINTEGQGVKCLGQFKTVEPRRVNTQGFTIRDKFSTLVIQNGVPGLTSVRLTLNGAPTTSVNLTPGQTFSEPLTGPVPNRLLVQGLGTGSHSAVAAVWGQPVD